MARVKAKKDAASAANVAVVETEDGPDLSEGTLDLAVEEIMDGGLAPDAHAMTCNIAMEYVLSAARLPLDQALQVALTLTSSVLAQLLVTQSAAFESRDEALSVSAEALTKAVSEANRKFVWVLKAGQQSQQ